MKRLIITGVLLLASLAAHAQSGMEKFLDLVEENNPGLRAQRHLRDARTLDARRDNVLEDPRVEYTHKKSTASDGAGMNEIGITQGFDFPGIYAAKRKLSRMRGEQYGHEYEASRMAVLLEAKQAYIELQQLARLDEVYAKQAENAAAVAEIYGKMLAKGQVSVMQKNKVDYQMLTSNDALLMNRAAMETLRTRLTQLSGGVETAIERSFEIENVMELTTVLADYLATEPSLRAVAAQQMAAEQEVRVSRQKSLPKLEVGYVHEFGGGERFNGVTVGMSLPIFANRHNVKRAKAGAAYAEAELEESKTTLESNLRSLYAELARSDTSLKEYIKRFYAEDRIAAYNKALALGEISIVEYFEETDAYYGMLEKQIEITTRIRLLAARVNMIYL